MIELARRNLIIILLLFHRGSRLCLGRSCLHYSIAVSVSAARELRRGRASELASCSSPSSPFRRVLLHYSVSQESPHFPRERFEVGIGEAATRCTRLTTSSPPHPLLARARRVGE